MNLFRIICVSVLCIIFSSIEAQSPMHFIVTSTSDQSSPFPPYQAGTLRKAIDDANTHPGLDYIDFNIQGNPPQTITLLSTMPAITESVIMDGLTQPGNLNSGKKIKIQGFSSIFIFSNAGNSSLIKDIEFIAGSYIPIDVLVGAKITFINNLVYNQSLLVALQTDGNVMKNNIIGTDNSFSTSANFNNSGVLIRGNNNIIGGLLPGEKNYFYNFVDIHAPLDIQTGSRNKVSGNVFINCIKNIDIYSNYQCLGNNCKQIPVFTTSFLNGLTTITGSSSNSDFIEIYKSNSNGIDAVSLVGTVTANTSGQFTLVVSGLIPGDKIIATATDMQNNTSEFTNAKTITSCPSFIGADYKINICSANTVSNNQNCDGKCKTIDGTLLLGNTSTNLTYSVVMNFGDGSPTQTYISNSSVNFSHSYGNGTYTVTSTIQGVVNCTTTHTFVVNITCTPPPCTDCIGSFAPIPTQTYVLSAWVKEPTAPANTTSYTNASININFFTALTTQGGSQIGTTLVNKGQGIIIDGWQKIETKFVIPGNAASIKIDLISGGTNALFDDVRVHPVDANMKSFVYDALSKKLVAELDERNYASLYEYDEEGKLIRVKKETERGIMTIKENRSSMPVKE